MVDEYRVASDEEKQGRCSQDYDLLIGPGGFECMLGEPEDRIWCRDGRDVVNELNRLKDKIEVLEEDLRDCRINTNHAHFFTRD